MKKTLFVIIILIILVGGYYIFFNTSSNSTPTPLVPSPNIVSSTPPVSDLIPPTPVAPQSEKISINIKDFAFNPSTVNIKVGTQVTWTNNDSVSHTITSDVGTLLKSNTLSPGQSFSFTFTKTGTETYHCNIHKMMKGTITVTN